MNTLNFKIIVILTFFSIVILVGNISSANAEILDTPITDDIVASTTTTILDLVSTTTPPAADFSTTTENILKTTSTPNITTISATTSTITLFWNDIIDATSYEVSSTITSSFSTINTSTTFFDLTPNTEYFFQVREFNDTDYSDFSLTTSTITTATSTDDSGDNSGGDNSGGGGNSNILITDSQINDSVNKLVNFLKSKQSADGMILDSGISDWAAMTFGSKGIFSDTIKNSTTSLKDYIHNFTITSASDNNLCAGYPRHILALLASGISKTDTKIIDLKNKINDTCVVSGAYGEDGINDDVFGLIALKAIDESNDSPAVLATINGITANQNQTSGAFISWGAASSDITGAAINALKYVQNKGVNIDENIFTKAEQYLKSAQLSDGGWCYDVTWCNNTSDALTTSWVVMGINALGKTQSDWFNSAGKNPWYILTNLDGTDHYNSAWSSDGVDWFATKHAVPALLRKNWPVILEPQLKSNNNQNQGGGSANLPSVVSTTLNVTSTLIVTTTVATTTLTTTTTLATTSTLTVATTTVNISSINNQVAGIKITNTKTNKPVTTTNRTETKKPKTTIPTSTFTLNSAETTKNENKIIDDLPLDTPTKKHAKRILAITGGSALAVGVYLGLRLLRNMV